MGLRSSVRNILRCRWVFSRGHSQRGNWHFLHCGFFGQPRQTSYSRQSPRKKSIKSYSNSKHQKYYHLARMYEPRKKKSIIFLPVSSHTQSCSYPAVKTNQSSFQRKKYTKTCGIVFVTTIASKELLFSRFNASPLNLQDDKYFNDSKEKLTWKCRESRLHRFWSPRLPPVSERPAITHVCVWSFLSVSSNLREVIQPEQWCHRCLPYRPPIWQPSPERPRLAPCLPPSIRCCQTFEQKPNDRRSHLVCLLPFLVDEGKVNVEPV